MLDALPSTRKDSGSRSILEAGSIISAIKSLRGYLLGMKFRVFSDHKILKNIGIVGDHDARVRRWFEYLTAFDYALEDQKSTPMVMSISFHGYHSPRLSHITRQGLRPTPLLHAGSRLWLGWADAPAR